MTTPYRIDEEDYVNAMRLFARFSSRQVIALSGCAVFLIAFAVFGSGFVQAAAIGALIGGLVATVIGRYVVAPILARRHYRKYKAIHDEFTVELLDDGVRFTSPSGNAKITWDKMLKWRENDHYILIYLMPRIYHLVPKAVASRGFDLDRLTSGLLQHVGKPV